MKRLHIAALIVFVTMTFTAGLARSYPFVSAVACPSCFGLANLGENIFVESTASATEKTRVLTVIHEARGRVSDFYDKLQASPRILACVSDSCYRNVGGGNSSGMALLDLAVLLSRQGTETTIAAHELSHIELHRRLGFAKTFFRAIPQWFDEGLAVLISDDRRYLAPARAPDRCILTASGSLPEDRNSWVVSARTGDLYAAAGCRVYRWVRGHGGSSAVTQLIDELSRGGSFKE